MRRLKAILAAAAIATAGVAGVPAPAHAAPTDCQTWLYSYGSEAWCQSGTGTYRTVATCHVNVTGGGNYKACGKWTRPSQDDSSFARCNSNSSAIDEDLQKRN